MIARASSFPRLLVVVSLLPVAALARKPGGLDALPQLISTGPKWSNLTEIQRYAAEGDSVAAFELAERHMDGDGVPLDHAEARRWFRRAADGGVADAWFRLGKLHHDGLGVPRDRAQAFVLFTEAAKRGVPEAQHNVGAMLVSARGVKRDYVEGLAWLIVAGKSGAESSAEQQVRDRLKRRPRDIEKAEARAAELLAAMGRSGADGAPEAVTVSAPAAPTPPKFTPDVTPPPKIDIGAPKIEVAPPKITVPGPGRNE
jgi:uncharacterized protein